MFAMSVPFSNTIFNYLRKNKRHLSKIFSIIKKGIELITFLIVAGANNFKDRFTQKSNLLYGRP